MPMMSRLSERASAAFEAVGEPPDDEDDLLVWGRKVLAKVAWLLTIDEIDQTRARGIKDAVFAIGSTHNKAKLEGKFKKLKATVTEYQQVGSAITEVPGKNIQRPSTARGGEKPAPKIVAEDPADDDGEPEE